MTHVFLDGQSLTIEQVHLVAHHPEVQVRLSETCLPGIQKSADAVAQLVAR